MFTSSTGALVEPGTPDLSGGARNTSPFATTLEDNVTSKIVGPAEKITYLYR